MNQSEILEDILDIIDSENSGLSAEQRIEEIRKTTKESLLASKVYKRIIDESFHVSLNCNDFFAFACAWALDVYPEDIEWMSNFASSKPAEDFWPATNACMAYIANREPIKPHINEKFTEYIEELKSSNQQVFSDIDYEQFQDGGPYRELDKS